MSKAKPGPKSLKEVTGEETVMVSFMVTKSEKEFISSQDVPMAQFLRRLIDTEMALQRINVDPEKVDHSVLRGIEMILNSLRNEIVDVEENRAQLRGHEKGAPAACWPEPLV